MNISTKLFKKVFVKMAEVILIAEELPEEIRHKTKRFREKVCNNNSGICYDKNKDKCKECGCIISAKSKMLKNYNIKKNMRVEITHCPLGKWNDEEIAEHYKNFDN